MIRRAAQRCKRDQMIRDGLIIGQDHLRFRVGLKPALELGAFAIIQCAERISRYKTKQFLSVFCCHVSILYPLDCDVVHR